MSRPKNTSSWHSNQLILKEFTADTNRRKGPVFISTIRKGAPINLLVPNAPELFTNDGNDLGKIIEQDGYRLIVNEPKYQVVQQ